MFDMTDKELLSNGIKIVDGIAGGGKSSKIDQFFRENDLSYERLTSTNRLRRDATDRFNMNVKTVAAGLFTNHGAHFYAEEKAPSSPYIVIDEILQTSPRAIEWCANHQDEADIIITTDSKQLLSPEHEEEMIEAFTKLRMSKNVIYRNVNETLRPRNEKTRKIYHELYGKADLPIIYNANEIINTFPNIIYYEDMEYTPEDAYITHDNATEDFLYKDKSFATNPFLDLIPKGYLASRPPKDLSKYPLLSQLEANKTKARSYTQVMNVGSPVRFQGSEVDSDHKLYYIIQPNSIISARELYTVITRLWDIDCLRIVLINTPKSYSLSTFNDKPVKVHKYLTLNEVKEPELLSPQKMDKLLSQYDTDEVYYDRNYVRNYKGDILYTQKEHPNDKFNPRQVTAGSLARRDAALNYSYMDLVYSIIEDHGLKHISPIQAGRQHDEYEIDLVSAYPTILKYDRIPTDGIITTDGPFESMMNFYIYHKDENAPLKFNDNAIITDDLAHYIEDNHYGTCEYIFSTPCTTGCFPGDYLYQNTHDTKEKKQETKKTIHYGYYQKPYIRLSFDGSCYVKYEDHIYELFFCNILSQMLYYMLKIYNSVGGTALFVDAVQISCYNPDVIEKVRSVIPDYMDFRIKVTGKTFTMIDGEMVESDGILYQSCPDLPTKKDKLKKQNKEWHANRTEKQKADKRKKSKDWYNNMTEEQRERRREQQRKRYQEKKERKKS